MKLVLKIDRDQPRVLDCQNLHSNGPAIRLYCCFIDSRSICFYINLETLLDILLQIIFYTRIRTNTFREKHPHGPNFQQNTGYKYQIMTVKI